MSHTLSYEYYTVTNWSGYYFFNNGNANSLSYIFTLARNSVNAPIYPREGSSFSFSVQLTPPYSLFGHKDYSTMTDQQKYKWLEFHKWKFNASWFTRIVQNLVLNVRFKMGFMGCYNKEIGIPPFGRFYLGGDAMSTFSYDGREVIGMRGYDDEVLSPYVNGSSTGASIYQKFTAELRYPISLNPSATRLARAGSTNGSITPSICTSRPASACASICRCSVCSALTGATASTRCPDAPRAPGEATSTYPSILP